MRDNQLLAAGVAFSAWFVLLLSGLAAGGAIHLLLGAALVLAFRALRAA